MFGIPEGIFNGRGGYGRQGFGPLGDVGMPIDPRNDMRNRGMMMQSPMQQQPMLNLQQPPWLFGKSDQKQLFGPR